ncbi:fimbrial biogenesis outer membrane usher protein [Salmonella enterica subsp. enterica]|nr:fimbrial biogenesis outer membrane usher protein [Salmonella enterica subsp. enterica]
MNKRILYIYFFIFFQNNLDAKENFNYHALEIDNNNQQAVDLSNFTNSDSQLAGTYRVNIYVNGEKNGDAQDIIFVTGKNNKLVAKITPAMLKKWGVKIDAFPELAVLPQDKYLSDIAQYIPMSTTDLQFSKLQLNVSIPQAAIKTNAREWVEASEWDDGIPAALINYNLTGSNTWYDEVNGSKNNYYANFQSGINFGPWRLRNYSTWIYNEDNGSHWGTVYNYIQRDIQYLRGQLLFGDSYTSSDIFDSVQFRGAQFVTDDNMLPDSLRGFAPVIRGIAQSNAQVTVKQNGYIIYQSYVPPGAFTINDLYPTSGSGDMEVTIKEADGSERTFIQPYSAVPIMQREGYLKYAITAGQYHSDNNDSNEPGFGQITAIYGLPHAVTIYSGMLYSVAYQSGAIGFGMGLDKFGSISADITVAYTTLNNDENHNGQSYRVQYAKNFQTTDTSFSLAAYRYSTIGFYTFQEANDLRVESDDGWQMMYNKRQRLQLDLTQGIGNYGSFFISGYQQDFWYRDGYERTLSAGWNSNIEGISYNITYSYSNYPENTQSANQQLALNIMIPFNRFMPNTWASYSINTSKHGDTRQQLGLNGTALADNNLNYSLQQSYTNHGVGSSGNININYKGGKGEITGSYNYISNQKQVNYGLKGGIVAHPYGVTLSQTLGESLALVRVPGADNAKIQNNTGIYTDEYGYAIVPYVNPYKKNRIALDTSTLGDDVEIESAVQSVIPTRGAVTMANFNTHVGQRVLMTLFYHELPVPFGAQVKVKDGSNGIVGEDGLVYLSGLQDEGDIMVSWNGVQQCQVHYHLDNNMINRSSVMMMKQDCL